MRCLSIRQPQPRTTHETNAINHSLLAVSDRQAMVHGNDNPWLRSSCLRWKHQSVSDKEQHSFGNEHITLQPLYFLQRPGPRSVGNGRGWGLSKPRVGSSSPCTAAVKLMEGEKAPRLTLNGRGAALSKASVGSSSSCKAVQGTTTPTSGNGL